jgi:hypothetical protein
MNIQPEFEREKDGNWVARLPDFPEVVGRGRTHHEAVVGLTVRGLRVLAERIESRSDLPWPGWKLLDLEDEPQRILESMMARDRLVERLVEILFGLEGSHTPNAETIAAIKELEAGGGESFENFEDLIAKLNAD